MTGIFKRSIAASAVVAVLISGCLSTSFPISPEREAQTVESFWEGQWGVDGPDYSVRVTIARDGENRYRLLYLCSSEEVEQCLFEEEVFAAWVFRVDDLEFVSYRQYACEADHDSDCGLFSHARLDRLGEDRFSLRHISEKLFSESAGEETLSQTQVLAQIRMHTEDDALFEGAAAIFVRVGP